MARAVSPLDSELAARLDDLAPLTASVLSADIAAMREGARRGRITDRALARGGRIRIDEYRIPASGHGAEIALLVLRPAHAESRVPGLCFLHGGGMIAGDERTGIEAVLDWVIELGFGIASLAYRLAPEHPHPTPVEDCYAGLAWIGEHRAELGFDPGPLFLAGASAGGGLSAGSALLARERDGPEIAGLMLMAPMLDDRARFGSSTAFAGGVPWDAQSNRTGWAALLGGAAGSATVPAAAAPGRARDLSGMPPTFLDVGAMETFRDEVIDFAGRLSQAGAPTELHVWGGAFHGFDILAPDSTVAQAARGARIGYLRRFLRNRRAT